MVHVFKRVTHGAAGDIQNRVKYPGKTLLSAIFVAGRAANGAGDFPGGSPDPIGEKRLFRGGQRCKFLKRLTGDDNTIGDGQLGIFQHRKAQCLIACTR